MPDELVVVAAPESAIASTAESAIALHQDVQASVEYLKESRTESTKRVYRQVWRDFQGWCATRGVPDLPATRQTVGAYLAHLAGKGLRYATIDKHLAAICVAHQLADEPSPRSDYTDDVMRGIARTHGKHQRPVVAMSMKDLKKCSAALPATLHGIRNRAMLVLGYGGAFRESELVAIDVEHLVFEDDGVRVFLPRSKVDQQGQGETKPVLRGTGMTCPVRTIRAWLEASGITEGAVFREISTGSRVLHHRLSPQTVYRVVRDVVERAGVEGRYGGHSLRSGFITAAAKSGAPLHSIMKTTLHKDPKTVLRYIHDATLFDDHAAAKIGM